MKQIEKKPTIKELYRRNICYADEFRRKLDKLFIHNSDIPIPKKIELILHENGSIGWDIKNKRWVRGNWDGIRDELNDYVNYVCKTLDSTPDCYTLKNHSEVIVCGNNSLYTPDNLDNLWYSTMLEETDISIFFQLINSRNIPMVVADDDDIKREIEIAFSNLQAGKPAVITTGLMNDAKTLDITDNTSIDRISTLDNFHEEMLKRWCNKYGIDVETKEKKAQVNNMELDSFGDFDSLNFLEMYEARLEFAEEMKANNINYEVVRNPVYWDEPTEEDVENGSFEENEEENQEGDNSDVLDKKEDNIDKNDSEDKERTE